MVFSFVFNRAINLESIPGPKERGSTKSTLKYTALRKYRRKKTASNKLKLRTLSQEVKYVIRAKHRDYLEKIESSFKDNPKLL